MYAKIYPQSPNKFNLGTEGCIYKKELRFYILQYQSPVYAIRLTGLQII